MAIVRKYRYKTKCNACGKIDLMSRSDTYISHMKCARCKEVGTTKYIRVKRHKTSKQFRFQQQVCSR